MASFESVSRRRLLGGALAGSAGLGLSALLPPRHAFAASTLEIAKSQGYIRVGFANEPPYGYADETGKLTGEAPEILRVVLKSIGINEIDGVLTEFAALIPGLQAKRFDIVSAGMAVRPDRCEQILFSEPTYSVSTQLAVKPGNPKKIATYIEVAANKDVRIGILAGSIAIKEALDAGVQQAQISTFPDMPGLIAALRADRVDTIVGTSLTWGDVIKKLGEGNGLEALEPFTEVAGKSVVSHGAFGFRKEDADLRDTVNEALKPFIGTAEHLALVEPFSFSKYTLPVKTTDQMCRGA